MGLPKSGPRFLVPLIIILGIITAGAFAVVQYQIAVEAEDPDAVVEVDLDPTVDNEGNIAVLTRLKNAYGEVIREVDDWQDEIFQDYSIVDPETDEVVKYYSISAWWVVKGQHIKWSTLSVTTTLVFTEYQCPAATKIMTQNLEELTITDLRAEGDGLRGDCNFADIDLEALMPDEIIVLYHVYNEETGNKEPIVEHYPQKTSDPHPFSMSFEATFTMNVQDDYGNQYQEQFLLKSTLGLMWGGSSFDVEWGSSDDTDGEQTTGQDPVLTHPNDLTFLENSGGHVISWTVSDIDDNGNYFIEKDGYEIDSGVWTDGDTIQTTAISKPIGSDIYTLTVTDSSGRTVTNDVKVFVIALVAIDTKSTDGTTIVDNKDDFGSIAEEFDSFERVGITTGEPGDEIVGMNVMGLKLSGYAVAIALVMCVTIIAVGTWYSKRKK